MNVELFPHDDGFRVVATNAFGESQEVVLPSDHPVSTYVVQHRRLNSSYLVYWLTEQPSKKTDAMLKHLNRANDGFRARRVRAKGWENKAGLSTGEVPSTRRPGDVVVHGNVADITLIVTESTNGE